MHPSRPIARTILLLVAGLAVVGCSATTPSPSGLPAATPSLLIASSRPAPAASPLPSGSAPTGSARASDPPDPTDPPEPTEAPTPTPSQIAGCGTGEAGFAAHRSEIPKTLAFGHASIEFTTAGLEMRDGSMVTGDSIPGGVGLTADEIAVVVAPGEHIVLRAPNAALVETTAAAVSWSTVKFENGLAALSGPRTALPWRVRADGSLSVSAPDQVGDWAVEFLPRWQGDCLKGDGTAYARIKVR